MGVMIFYFHKYFNFYDYVRNIALGYLCSENGDSLATIFLVVNLYVYGSTFILLRLNPFELSVDRRIGDAKNVS